MSITRNTKAKQAVLEELEKSPYALSQPDIFDRLKGTCNRVTVYRILDRLVGENRIHKVVNVDGIINYALCNDCDSNEIHSHDHLHFSCTQCKHIECLEEQQIIIDLPKDYQIKEIFLTISGVCPRCSVP
jgi:Fur family transcriptional regulator, ferric uptake regulator